MNVYSLTVNDIQAAANDAVRIVLKFLENDGVLTMSADDVCATYAIVAYEKGMLGKFIDRITNQDENSISYRVVKLRWGENNE